MEEELRRAGFRGDYVELADAESQERLGMLGQRPASLLDAARIGGTRLIDNMPVERLTPCPPSKCHPGKRTGALHRDAGVSPPLRLVARETCFDRKDATARDTRLLGR
jgi:hypothetical protein